VPDSGNVAFLLPGQGFHLASLPESGRLLRLTGRIHDLINHLADPDRGNAFYCNSPEHERIADLAVIREKPLGLSFTLSLDPDTGSVMRAKDFLGEVLGCSASLVSQFRISKESLSF
jgi:hypothetical protein